MKFFYLTLFAFLTLSNCLKAQWTTGVNINNTNAGNVGIGTATPMALLSVSGTTLLNGQMANLDPVLPSSDLSYLANNGQLLIGWNRTSGQGEADFIGNKAGGGIGGFAFYDYSNANVLSQLVRITSAGNMGIGVALPTEKLVVNGNISLIDGDSFEIGSSNAVSWANTKILTRGFANNIDFTDILVPAYLPNAANIRLLANGNVGIGTINPDSKLSVNGIIHSQEVKVDMNGWSDYVFDPSYKLLPLAEVKSYIEKNNHLPTIPSAQEVTDKGLNLGEMNKLLMKKVEELTLYLIEKDQQVKEEQEVNKKQQEDIDVLKQQVALIKNDRTK